MAFCQFDEKEMNYMSANKALFLSLHLKTKEIVRTLLLCRYEIFQIADQLQKSTVQAYKCIKPDNIAKLFLSYSRRQAKFVSYNNFACLSPQTSNFGYVFYKESSKIIWNHSCWSHRNVQYTGNIAPRHELHLSLMTYLFGSTCV